MTPSNVTPTALCELVLNPARRRELLAAVNAERGRSLPLSNAVARAAMECAAAPAELAAMVEALMAEDADAAVLDWLVLHPDVPERCLFRLLDAGRCVHQLGHRRGPEGLLLRIAAEHPDTTEAILTLALVHYGPTPGRGDRFLEFVRGYLHVGWLRESLRKSDLALRIPPDRLRGALDLVEQYEKTC